MLDMMPSPEELEIPHVFVPYGVAIGTLPEPVPERLRGSVAPSALVLVLLERMGSARRPYVPHNQTLESSRTVELAIIEELFVHFASGLETGLP